MDDSRIVDDTDHSIAQLILAMLWCASAPVPAVHDAEAFLLPGATTPQDMQTASRWLASASKPVWAIAVDHNGAYVRVEIAPPPAEPQTVSDLQKRAWRLDVLLSFSRHAGSAPLVIVAGGRGFRVSADALERMAAQYWLSPPLAASGGPVADPWVQALGLPKAWLTGDPWAFAIGKQHERGFSIPLRGPGGWDGVALQQV